MRILTIKEAKQIFELVAKKENTVKIHCTQPGLRANCCCVTVEAGPFEGDKTDTFCIKISANGLNLPTPSQAATELINDLFQKGYKAEQFGIETGACIVLSPPVQETVCPFFLKEKIPTTLTWNAD